MLAWQTGQAVVTKMELEVSYDESYCLEGRVERQRGATEGIMQVGEAVGLACVDRHIFFITPLMVCLERQVARAPTMSPTPPQARTNQDSYGGVAGQKKNCVLEFPIIRSTLVCSVHATQLTRNFRVVLENRMHNASAHISPQFPVAGNKMTPDM